MTIAWREMDTKGRIEAVRSVWYPGASSAKIAACFEGATRNAVIGIFHRYPNSFIDMPLNRTAVDEAHRKSTKRKQSPIFLLKDKSTKPLPAIKVVATESHLCGRPLTMLAAKQCRWPINNAQGDELHLFCGSPAVRSYCEHHTTRSINTKGQAA